MSGWRASVRMVLEIPVSGAWDSETTIAQVTKQATDTARTLVGQKLPEARTTHAPTVVNVSLDSADNR